VIDPDIHTSLQFGSYSNLTLKEVPLSAVKPHEVLVKTHAVSLQVWVPWAFFIT
jgi:hypothetical protein